MVRFHILLEDGEKERFRRLARREGKSLGEWMREAARAKAREAAAATRLDTAEALTEFFEECDRRNDGLEQEPVWEVQKRVIAESMQSGGEPP